jgi:hypothetical protein
MLATIVDSYGYDCTIVCMVWVYRWCCSTVHITIVVRITIIILDRFLCLLWTFPVLFILFVRFLYNNTLRIIIPFSLNVYDTVRVTATCTHSDVENWIEVYINTSGRQTIFLPLCNLILNSFEPLALTQWTLSLTSSNLNI